MLKQKIKIYEIIKDGTKHGIKIAKQTDKQSYIQYKDLDRRLDEWIDNDQIDWNNFIEVDQVEEDLIDQDPRLVEQIQFQHFEIDTWYYSPYPTGKYLYICKYCLKYIYNTNTYYGHQAICRLPLPGKPVYINKNIQINEIDGKIDKLFCQNLSLLGKLFIQHKTIYFDIEPFLFYILIVKGKNGREIVGYFSKEKFSPEGYNLSCIVVFPPYQKKGYGSLLIEFSYELCRVQQTIGGPERPLSDFGIVGYHSYWKSVLLNLFAENPNIELTLDECATVTCIKQEDILCTLNLLGFLNQWKGLMLW
ncbi:acyl-CoA N-acyltransferase [Globomyces pollinis-pini]|nr:acyl-CoA N-acyltransferase [Globomyces pollinis-pini]